MRVPLPWRQRRSPGNALAEPLGCAAKVWMVVCLVVLVGSLFLLAIAVTFAFVRFGDAVTPLWVIVLGGAAALGIAAGFGGFALLMAVAGWRSFRKARRVEVLPPEHPRHP